MAYEDKRVFGNKITSEQAFSSASTFSAFNGG
jgi:hypothetical protein